MLLAFLQGHHTPSVSGTPSLCHRVSDEIVHENIYNGKLLQAFWQVNAFWTYTATTSSSSVNTTGIAEGFLSEMKGKQWHKVVQEMTLKQRVGFRILYIC